MNKKKKTSLLILILMPLLVLLLPFYLPILGIGLVIYTIFRRDKLARLAGRLHINPMVLVILIFVLSLPISYASGELLYGDNGLVAKMGYGTSDDKANGSVAKTGYRTSDDKANHTNQDNNKDNFTHNDRSNNSDSVKNPSPYTDSKTNKDKVNTENDFKEVMVLRVVDGDTIVVDYDGISTKLRMIGIDTPESVHPNKPVEYFAIEASNYSKDQLSGKSIYLQRDVTDRDRYGRLLRYVWLERPRSNTPSDEEVKKYMFNAQLLMGGYAQVYTYPPDTKYNHLFLDLQRQARENFTGLWGNKEENNSVGNEKLLIKGNKNSMIYHLPGGDFYDKVSEKNAVYFNSIQEAETAGYRASKK